jgi:hypothetical protein
MIVAQPSAFSGQLSAEKELSDTGRVIKALHETAFADSLLLRAEGLKK